MFARGIIALLTTLNKVDGFYYEESATTEPSNTCMVLDPFTSCSKNPVAPDSTEIVPVRTITCGDSINGDTTGTPAIGNNGLGRCGTSAGSHGIWYKFEDSSSCFTSVTFETCAAASYDTKIQVFDDADCTGDTPTCVDGNDDGVGCANSRSRVKAGTTARRYYVWVNGFSTRTGTFTLDVICENNAPCATALPACSTNPVAPDGTEIVPETTIKCGDSINGDTTGTPGVGNNGLNTCGTETGNHGLWYKFEDLTTCFNKVTFETCHLARYDSKIQVFDYAACTGGAPTCVGGDDDTCEMRSRFTISKDATRRYYVFVTGNEAATGTFQLDVTCTSER